MELLKSILRLIFVLAKYIFVAASLFLGSLSVTTQKFPPPVQEFYQNMQSFRETMQSGPNLAETVQIRKEYQKNLDAITDGGGSVKTGNCSAERDQLSKEVRAQKVEIAHLKSELERAQISLLEFQSSAEKR